MNNIFSSIQHYLASVVAAVTATILVIFPFSKPQTQPTPTPVPISIQEVKGVSTPLPSPEVRKINSVSKQISTPTPTITSLPTPTPDLVYQAPRVSVDVLCNGYANELRATTRTMVGTSIYDSNPYYELTTTRFYNYCLANNGNTNGFTVEPPPAILTPTTMPAVIQDNSAWIKTCNDSIAIIEADKQKAVNEAIAYGQKVCVARAMDDQGCESYTQAQIDKVAPFYDGLISNYRLSTGCY